MPFQFVLLKHEAAHMLVSLTREGLLKVVFFHIFPITDWLALVVVSKLFAVHTPPPHTSLILSGGGGRKAHLKETGILASAPFPRSLIFLKIWDPGNKVVLSFGPFRLFRTECTDYFYPSIPFKGNRKK